MSLCTNPLLMAEQTLARAEINPNHSCAKRRLVFLIGCPALSVGSPNWVKLNQQPVPSVARSVESVTKTGEQ